MQKFIFTVLMLLGIGDLHSQSNKLAPKPVSILKTNADSVSYVLGEVTAFALKEKGLGDVKITNSTAFLRAMDDILGKKPPLLDDVTANALLNNYMTKLLTVARFNLEWLTDGKDALPPAKP